MGLIAVACIVGTVIKQEPYDPSAAIAHYGRALGLLIGLLGLNRLYSTWWFVGLLLLFAANTAACAFWKRRFSLRMLGSMLAHASILFIVAGVIVRGLVGVDGTLTIAEGETVDSFRTARGVKPLGFQLRLDDFELRYYEGQDEELLVHLQEEEEPRHIPVEAGKVVPLGPDGTAVEVLTYLPHFMKDGEKVFSASDTPVNPAVQVKWTGPAGESTEWLFAKFPDFHGSGSRPEGVHAQYVRRPPQIKAFESHVTALNKEGQVLQEGSILVNEPMKIGRYTLYQVSYDPETEAISSLDVTYDPGVPLVFIGFILMPLGMAFTFYVKPFLNRKDCTNV